MNRYWEADLRDCPPTVVLCRVAYRLIARRYKVNPLHFGNPWAAIYHLSYELDSLNLVALARACRQAADYMHTRKCKLALWRFDVCRVAGKAIQRSRDRRLYATSGGDPRITNRGVSRHQRWLEVLPADLPDVRAAKGRARCD